MFPSLGYTVRMSEWTLGAARARGMQLEAYCETKDCKRFLRFDLDLLIESVGAGYPVSGIPPMTCQACGGRL